MSEPGKKKDVYAAAIKFRNQLRKALKTTRKTSLKECQSPMLPGRKLSDLSDGPTEAEKAVVVEYLKMT